MHQPSCPIEIAEQGSWYSTMKPYCSCPKFNDDITVNNFLQVGETIECGSCHPDKFEHCTTIQGKYGVKCECICHKVSSWKKQAESPQEDWIDELDKCYGTIEQRKNIDYYDLLEFIRGLLTPKQ